VSRDRDWSPDEIDAIVADYFDMLAQELVGRDYVKAEHRRALLPRLDRRSEGSIEMKHCNISAVLDHMGLPYIDGYKPRKNLQDALRAAVAEYVKRTRLSARHPLNRQRT
jgi:hypothetical protein